MTFHPPKNAKVVPLRFQKQCGFTQQRIKNDRNLHGNAVTTENAVLCIPDR